MTSITALANELKEIVAWQRTPDVVTDAEFERMIIFGLKTLYIDTGRARTYSDEMIIHQESAPEETTGEEGEEEETVSETFFNADLPIDEEKYVLLTAEIAFFKKVQSDVNNIVGYTTDALSITNADKPYAHLQDTIRDLESERRIVFFKMTPYTFYYA